MSSKYALVIYAAKRARQINDYYNQLGDGILEQHSCCSTCTTCFRLLSLFRLFSSSSPSFLFSSYLVAAPVRLFS